ncbi:ObirGr4 [Ooceraea biroi]|uniref:Gustatory receptor n=1 Tax=Ooceraea biroi TaxID=2015173 RepID=A0A026W761_OOCBI|nr:putative gustatory receptor 28a [Ooceraea biroi]EZA50864.1 hypothetical protein X777_10498 [Ooceraea biroi]RLU25338.1 ObirGr4 [Ooceraea biroi]
MRHNGEKLNISFTLKEEGDGRREDVPGSVKNSVLMDPYKLSDLLGTQKKVNATARKISKEKAKTTKVESPRNFFCRFWISLSFFKLIGLATFTLCIVTQHKRTLNTFRYSKRGIAYNVALISLMIASNFLSIPFRLHMEYENKTNLTVGIEILQTILGTIVICTILFRYCVDQKCLVRIANQLMDIEHEVDRLYRSCSLQRQRVRSTLIVACAMKFCLLIVLLITEIYAFHASPISWLTDILPTFHVGWLMMQYFLLVTIIQADFADVNRAIQSLSRVSTPDLRPRSPLCQTRRVVVSNSSVCQLLQLRDAHCHLCDIAEGVSGFYSLPMLFGITFAFLTLIYNAYYLLVPLLISDEILQYELFINTVLWLAFLMYPIIILTNRISRILNEIGRTGNMVHSLLSCTLGKEARSELKQFSLQLLHRKIRFTANDYFALDNTFFHSMIGTVVTYLVILVQFEMGRPCSPRLPCNCTAE